VIREVARTLGAAARQQDRAGRIGGEEFLVVLPGATVAQAHVIAERMRTGVQSHHAPGLPGTIAVTVSIGVASVSALESGGSLVARANTALYKARSQGRNRVVVAATREAAADTQLVER
jgi:diguanylate cyclase (GGDEF)-like protein